MKQLIFSCLIFGLFAGISSCKKEPCETTECQNGGVCDDGSCTCPSGFAGELCETVDLNSYLGSYHSDYGGCISTSDFHKVSLERKPDNDLQVYLLDLGDYACPSGEIRLTADVIGTALEIAEQTVDCGAISYTFSGSGNFFQGDSLTISYSASYDAGGFIQTDNCMVQLFK
ncbi:hypothetical protein [Pontibacter sp. G13]|uniref:hypothetical protein n=1 Tax=Pontibacter sp. G13 TaxID=3074898 RepID=UPI00288AF49E|nr:hypothetical protein [Pontibacter sp. G13]WNJ16626.1 hypothetical protein RJD25_17310 [Pontibacter sp. G13]